MADDLTFLETELTNLSTGSSKKDLRRENEELRYKLREAKEVLEGLRMAKISMEKELDSVRRSNDCIRDENATLRRKQDDLQSKNDALKRELKFIRVAFRMGGLRYSCRALDKQDTGTIPVSAFRTIVMKSNVNLSDEETEIMIRKAMTHGDGQVIYYEAFFNGLTEC